MQGTSFTEWLDEQVRGWAPPAEGDKRPGRVDTRQMFGAQAYLIRGKMFAAVGPMGLMLKLPAEVRQPLLDAGTAGPFTPVQGASFGEWIAVPPDVFAETGNERLLALVRQSFDYVQVAKAAKPPREERHFRKRMY